MSDRPRGTTARGYGARHQRLRGWWAPQVAGGSVLCARCTWPIEPGTPWDLGHQDGSAKTRYTGPEHARCNRAAGGRQNANVDPAPRVRAWW